jgi:ferredoxin--NADP+ reductase/benzoate/toluate 1,2-dioxygenase reductase subunit
MPDRSPQFTPPFVSGTSRVLGVRFLTDSVFVLRFERNGFEFLSGQRLLVGRGVDLREYSIFSTQADPFLEILVKRIDGGTVSPMLASLSAGDEIDVSGPAGDFLQSAGTVAGRSHLFIASGTGIAPYRCLVHSTDGLDYRLLHGVRHAEERYCSEEFPRERYTACISKDERTDFHGRVTDWLKSHPVDGRTECYLCGNSDMIYECFSLLSAQGIGRDHIHAEIYF